MNRKALERIGWILQQMNREASKRDPPVFRAEHETRDTSFKILVFTMLSARTKDDTTARVVSGLFKVAKTPKAVAGLGTKKLEKLLYGVGFYKVKARHLVAACKTIQKKGMPQTLEGLLELPGVGRKTANIVLARAFGKKTLGVDVHVHRISNRLGIVKTKKPEETEQKLVKSVPEKYLPKLNRTFVAFGQTLCTPRNPACTECPLNKLCKRVGV
jgi:endonuclease-3